MYTSFSTFIVKFYNQTRDVTHNEHYVNTICENSLALGCSFWSDEQPSDK